MNDKKYTKTTWIDNKTCVDAKKLNKIESALEDLYESSLSKDQIVGEKGITVRTDTSGNKVIGITETPKSETLDGIEYCIGEPLEPKENVLYFILGQNGDALEKIMLNGVTIFTVT